MVLGLGCARQGYGVHGGTMPAGHGPKRVWSRQMMLVMPTLNSSGLLILRRARVRARVRVRAKARVRARVRVRVRVRVSARRTGAG